MGDEIVEAVVVDILDMVKLWLMMGRCDGLAGPLLVRAPLRTLRYAAT